MRFADKTIVLVGAPNDLMYSTVEQASSEGARVVCGIPQGSDHARLEGHSEISELDIHDETSLHTFFSSVKRFAHLVVFQEMGVQGVQWELKTSLAHDSFQKIFWFPFDAAKRGGPFLEEKGSIVFVCASSTRRPMKGMSVVGTANAALEALAANLAVEMAPRRANTVNPGLYLQAARAEEVDAVKEGKVGNVVSGLLAPGVDQPRNVGRTVLHLMADPGITGSVVDASVLMKGCCTADISGWVTIAGC